MQRHPSRSTQTSCVALPAFARINSRANSLILHRHPPSTTDGSHLWVAGSGDLLSHNRQRVLVALVALARRGCQLRACRATYPAVRTVSSIGLDFPHKRHLPPSSSSLLYEGCDDHPRPWRRENCSRKSTSASRRCRKGWQSSTAYTKRLSSPTIRPRKKSSKTTSSGKSRSSRGYETRSRHGRPGTRSRTRVR
jgi:hypothetical protein